MAVVVSHTIFIKYSASWSWRKRLWGKGSNNMCTWARQRKGQNNQVTLIGVKLYEADLSRGQEASSKLYILKG